MHRASTFNVHYERVILLWQHYAFALCCHSNATRAPIANLPNSAQLGASPTTPPSYVRVCAIVWACDRGQTDKHTHRHADARDHNTFRVVCAYAKCNPVPLPHLEGYQRFKTWTLISVTGVTSGGPLTNYYHLLTLTLQTSTV